MQYTAYVFGRPGGAVILGSPYGHVGFGFQTDDSGTARVGACEVVNGATSHVNNAMDFWTAETDDPLTFMTTLNPYGIETRYDMCKKLIVDAPNVAAAMAQITTISNTDYNLLSQNCRTDTVDILQAFGITGLPGGARPSGFFGGIEGVAIPLITPWPGLGLDFSIYTETDQYGLRDDPTANNEGYVADPTADENPMGNEWPLSLISSLLVRSGYLSLFSENDYRGETSAVPLRRVTNFRDVPWPDPMVRSWYASATEFDPTGLAAKADSITPRFATSTDRANHTAGLGLPPHFGLPAQRTVAAGH